jgi:hypothetical protein
MNTFLGLLTWVSAGGGMGESLPTSGTRLSVLSIELPQAITPTIAGLTVGAFVGVVGFVAVLLLVGRGSRRGTARRVQLPADKVVFIPPYGTLQRDTPLPPAAFHVPASSGHIRVAHAYAQQQPFPPPYAHQAPVHVPQALPFRPSTDLSARVFAKMGYDVGVVPSDPSDYGDSPHSDPELMIECEMPEEDEEESAAVAPVSVSAILVVEESGGHREAFKSDPHPLGIIPSGSSAMQPLSPVSGTHALPQPSAPPALLPSPRPVSFADLEMDDGATEIAETYFDEPPQPRRRSEPPKIRAIAPAAPRFPTSSSHLPRPTPPPGRAVPSARG